MQSAGEDIIVHRHGYGGETLLRNGQPDCTSGFVVRRYSDWLEGVLTAGHCEYESQIQQHNSSNNVVATFSSPFRGEHIGQSGDIEWHSTTHDDFPYFWSNTHTLIGVTGRYTHAQIYKDQYLCHYGRFGGRSCGNVSNRNTQTWTPNPWGSGSILTSKQVAVLGATDLGGDSGGPWFLGGTAAGIHASKSNLSSHLYFTPVEIAENYFGVFVQTS